MTNETLERHVTDELWWNPTIDSEAIAVSADDGIVTLRGTVGSFRQKREAKRAAERVYGVRNVNNKLDVRILTEHRREDVDILSPRPDAGEIHHSITKALERDATLDADNIAVSSSHGRVTLTGSVRSWSEHDTAVAAAWSAPGVITVDDRLRVNY